MTSILEVVTALFCKSTSVKGFSYFNITLYLSTHFRSKVVIMSVVCDKQYKQYTSLPNLPRLYFISTFSLKDMKESMPSHTDPYVRITDSLFCIFAIKERTEIDDSHCQFPSKVKFDCGSLG